MFQGVVHREVKTGFGSYVLKTDTLMQSTRLIFEKKSKFDTAFEGKAVENLYFCSQINRNLLKYLIMNKTTQLVFVTIALVCVGCSQQFWDNLKMINDGYQNAFTYQGALEKKYAANGSYQVESYSLADNDEKIKSHDIYYPTVLKTSTKKWPLVVIANGTGMPAKFYPAIFKHLASWGFIVVGNQEEWTWEGKSVSKSQEVVIAEGKNPKSPLYNKVDTEHIGLVGHSQGGMAVYTAASRFSNSHRYKALCTQSGTAVMLADSLGWDFLKGVKAPMLMMGGCGGVDANALSKLDDMVKSYNAIGSKQKVLGRIKNTDHGDMLKRGDAYMTAWMRYWLCGDKEAAKCFIGTSAEILSNGSWQDVRRTGL